jgi:hypothetical protein
MFAARTPKRKSKKPTTTLAKTYRKATHECPCLIKLDVSSIKAEKVVKAPKNPTTKNKRALGDSANFDSESEIKNPIKKHPIKLTANVPNANLAPRKPFVVSDTKKRAIVPKEPAMIRISHFVILFSFGLAGHEIGNSD